MAVNLQSLSIKKVQDFIPCLDRWEVRRNLSMFSDCIDQLTAFSADLQIPLDKIQQAVSNTFSHYRYHKYNCWTVYRSLVAKRVVTHQTKIKQQEDFGPLMKRRDFFALTIQKKLQDLGELLFLTSQEKFSEYLAKSSIGSHLTISLNLGVRQLTIESHYAKEQKCEKFSYDFRFTS